jgi:hypothetical protein
MFRKPTRTALIAVAAALFAGAASAETTGTSAAGREARVEYRYLGQGAYAFVTTSRTFESPYALTGRTSQPERFGQAGQFLNVGQGRYYIPATR